MILDKKALDDIQENDLQELIANPVAEPERKILDYKRDLPIFNDKGRREFLADVSSFANTIGGYLLFGVDEDAGMPIALPGVQVEDVDALKQSWDNLLLQGLSPRLPHLETKEIKLSSGKWVFILQIPRSWQLPHRVIIDGHGHFYAQCSTGKYRMDVQELRTAFELSGTLGKQVRNFRDERLDMIMTGELPVYLNQEQAKLVLHLIPFKAFDSSSRYDLTPLAHPDQRQLIEPLTLYMGKGAVRNGYRYRHNFDGLISSIQWAGNNTHSYVQFFRNGSVEAVDVSILSWSEKRIPGKSYEYCLCLALEGYIRALKLLRIDAPLFVLVSLLGVKDFTMVSEASNPNAQEDHPIDRSLLLVPEIILDHFDRDSRETMKPIFDTIWNAAGWSGSRNYDNLGKSTLPKEM